MHGEGPKPEGIQSGPEANFDSSTEVSQESLDAFKQRAEASTGVKFDEIPKGEENDLIGGHIFVKRGDLYVVGVDQYPEQDPESGEETFKEFRVVDLSGHTETK